MEHIHIHRAIKVGIAACSVDRYAWFSIMQLVLCAKLQLSSMLLVEIGTCLCNLLACWLSKLGPVYLRANPVVSSELV